MNRGVLFLKILTAISNSFMLLQHYFRCDNMVAIKEDYRLIDWLNQVCLSKTNNTRELYTTVMKKYCNLIGLAPTQLIEEAEKESGLASNKQLLSSHIVAFKNNLRENMSRTSQVTYLAAVSSFYTFYDIALSKKLVKRKEVPATNIENDFTLTDKMISDAFNLSPPLMKNIISIQYTSGLSMSDVLNLKAGIIRENLTEDCVTCLNMERQKTKIKFHTFLSPTATKLSLNQIINMKLEDNDFLICVKKGEQLKEGIFLELYRVAADSIGLKKSGFRGYNKFHSHNLRKMFYNTILNVGGWGMSELAEYFMGHKLPGSRAAYLKATPERMRSEYIKFVPHFEEVLNPVIIQNPIIEMHLKNRVEVAKNTTAYMKITNNIGIIKKI